MFKLKLKRAIASTLCAACVLTLASCSATGDKNNGEIVNTEDIKNEDIVLTLAGEDVDYEEYRYFYLNAKNTASSGDDSYWSENPDAAEKLKSDTLNSLAQFHAITSTAKEMGVELTEEDSASVDSTVQMYIDAYTEEKFNEMLEESFLSLDLFKEINGVVSLESKLYDAIVAEGTKFPCDDESIKSVLLGDDYVRVMHILYADEATAQGILEQAQNATDDEFYELAQSAEDGGMVDNKAGYCFTTGEMVEEFEKASFELEVGQTSGLVKSDYGYHIIRRLEKDADYIEENFENLKSSYLTNSYYKYIDTVAGDVAKDASFSPIYDALDIDTVK